MEMDIYSANLKAAFEKPGCPVCRLRQEAETAYIHRLQHDYVNDGVTRLGFVRSQGLCADHAWLFQASEQLGWNDGLKTAIIYESVASQVLQSLSTHLRKHRQLAGAASVSVQTKKPGGLYGWLARQKAIVDRWSGKRPPMPSSVAHLLARLEPQAKCPICEAIQGTESLIVAKLANEVLDPRFAAAFRASDGLCFPHLRQVLACSPSEDAAYLLVQAAQEWLVALLDHLRGYLDKHRWEDRSLLDPQESAAWIRTVAFFAGEYREGCSTDALSAMRQTAMEEHSSRACPEKAPGKARASSIRA